MDGQKKPPRGGRPPHTFESPNPVASFFATEPACALSHAVNNAIIIFVPVTATEYNGSPNSNGIGMKSKISPLWISICAVGVPALATIGAYAIQFGSSPISAKPEAWGQFGDYIGGTLNPSIAFGAFIWLALSVQLQKKELAETRAALEASQESQAAHAETAARAAVIQTFTVQLSSIAGELAHDRRRLETLMALAQERGVHASAYTPRGYLMLEDLVGEKCRQIDKLEEDERALVAKIKLLGMAFSLPEDPAGGD